jgi:hypothetical protein
MATNETAIELPKLNIQTMDILIVGDTPLICHRWSEKAKKQMLDKQMKKAKPGKEAKDPEQDFIDSLYQLPEGGFGFPVIAFKNAAVTACTSVDGITKVAARQAFRVGSTLEKSELVPIEGGKPEPREDMVRIGMGTADIRYRGQFPQWWCTVRVRFNANVLSAEQIVNLFNTAGFGVGVGEWRMEKDGQNGCFHVASTEESEAITKWRKAA